MPPIRLEVNQHFRIHMEPSPSGKARIDVSASDRVTVLALTAEGLNKFMAGVIPIFPPSPFAPAPLDSASGLLSPLSGLPPPPDRDQLWRSDNLWAHAATVPVPTDHRWYVVIVNLSLRAVNVDYSVRF